MIMESVGNMLGLADTLADGALWLADFINRSGPPVLNRPVLGAATWADLLTSGLILMLTIGLSALLVALLRRALASDPDSSAKASWRQQLVQATANPLRLLVWIYGLYLATAAALRHLAPAGEAHPVLSAMERLVHLGLFIAVVWLCYRLTPLMERRLAGWASQSRTRFDDVLIPFVGRSLRVIVPVMAVILALPLIGLPPIYGEVVRKGSSILVVVVVTYLLFQMVAAAEKLLLAEYDITQSNNLRARKVYTQVHVLGKTLHVLIVIFAAASILMLFEEVRRFGASILASAGVVGIIIGFAAQRTIANLFAGFQLAMTQPIRIDDAVVLEGEWGRIEEITLTYVVVKIWDQRRLIVPLSYFIEKPFQNWTRTSSDILGAVLFYVDYALPLEPVRQEARRIIEGSSSWDRKSWSLQVTDLTERSMQIRVLVSATDSGKAFDLRCEVREKLLGFIQKHYPESLPKLRTRMENFPADALPDALGEFARAATENTAPTPAISAQQT